MSDNIDLSRAYLTTPQAAERAKLTRAYLTILLKRHRLEGFQMGREWFIYADSLERFLSEDRKPGPRGPRKKKAQSETTDGAASFESADTHYDMH